MAKMNYSTEQRNSLLLFLGENPDKMFSARQIEEALCGKEISKSAIYRNLAELESEGKIKRNSKSGSRESFYQFFDCNSCRTHIHLSCRKCGKIFHLDDSAAENLVSSLEKNAGFEVSLGESTLVGICRSCGEKNEKTE